MISLKQIHYALAVEKTKHFKKAAELCAVSQSALSTAISELESQLGLQIFERDNKRVLITSAGAQFLEKAAVIKRQMDELYQLGESQKAPLSSPMTIGVIPTIGPFLLPCVLPELRRQYPDFPLKIVEDQSHVLVEKVRSGEIDTAILALPYPVTGLHAFEFWQEDFYILAHNEAQIAKRKKAGSAELKSENLLLLKDGHCLKDHALAACKLDESENSETLAATSLYTLTQLVSAKMGVTLIPQMAVTQLLSEGSDMKAIPLTDTGPHRRIAFVTRLGYIGVNSIELLKKLFNNALEKRSL